MSLLLFFQDRKQPAPATDPGSLVELRQVTNNTGYQRTAATAGSTVTVVSEHRVVFPAKALRFQTSANRIGNSLPSIVNRAGFVINGAFHQVTFGGEQRATFYPGERVVCDPLPDSVQVEAGDVIYSVIEHSEGSIYGTGTLVNEYLSRSVTNGPFTGVIPEMTSNGLSGGPTGLYGLTLPEAERKSSIVGVGDSFMNGGWFHFGTERNRLAWTDWSIWLDSTHTSVDADLQDRMPAEGPIPYDIAFIGWGGNDRSSDLDAWNRKSIASWRFFESRGQRVACKTLHPYTNSTDKWASVEGQTLNAPTIEPARVERNNWLRDGAPIDGADNPLPTGTTDSGAIRFGDAEHPVKYPVFDEADTCETERNSGLWKFDGGQWTADGTHLTGYGNSRMADAFTHWVADNLP